MSLLSRLAVQAARAYGILSSRSTNISADYLVVAGGGGGGGGHGGGGGAGGFRTSTATLSTLNTYSIAVGAGGLGGINYSDPTSRGSSGSNSSISGTGLSTITSTGGGGGGGYATNSGIGASGGSGGGGAGQTTSAGGSGTSGQGNSGGSGVTSAYAGAGGGGGASASGGNGSGTVGGTGGAGTASSISGSSVTYAGGGGGGIGVTATGGTGGAGGGGNGSSNGGTTAGGNGTVNTGGGGGGGGGDFPMNYRGGTGGSGIVIISYTSAEPKFVGGTITTSGGKQIHTFTSSGTLSPITPITASYLVVAGGGGSARQLGGYAGNGGGGAGGLLSGSTTIYSGATYVVTVGAGGAGGTTSGVAPSGSNSVLSGTGLTTLTSTGGGGGGGSTGPGANGGSGGGGSGEGTRAGGTGTSGQGNNGGNGVNAGGGGGGSGAAGANAVTTTGGAGGIGTQSSISGTATYYAGGGGGGAYSSGTAGTGGSGGGGNGGAGTSNTGNTPGTANTGGGAGGTAGDPATAVNGQSGGSGIVIISYAGSQVFNGGLVTTSGGNTIHTFTSTGALTPLTNNLNNSLRFRKSATAYLSRTPTVAGNRTTFTWSAWVKRGDIPTSEQVLFSAGSALNYCELFFLDSTIAFQEYVSGSQTITIGTPVYRDPSAWYHIVFVADTTNATAANRLRLYINGNQQTGFSGTSFAQNRNLFINSVIAHTQGVRWDGTTNPFDGYMTDINFIDGQALEPYYFGNNDANGVWKPIQYKGTYGTNGFYLTFGNTTSTTTLGYDSSPNGNNWTCNNISLTAGTTYDAMLDVPTNTSATVANYAVMNPLSSASGTLTNGNLTFSNAGAVKGAKGSFALESGKWYWENTITTLGANDLGVGILFDGATDAMRDGTATSTYSVFYQANTNVRKNGTVVANYASYTTGDIIGIAYDADTRSITFYKNNTSQGSITADAPTSPYVVWIIQPNTITATVNANFGQRPFNYSAPSGFLPLNTYNLATPTILQGNKYMDATLYTGNSGVQTVVNQAQFKPDFVWMKDRSNARNHVLSDSVRGTASQLESNTTAAQTTYPNSLTAFNSNGFTLGDDTRLNNSAETYVGWQWQAGQGTNTTNTAGSITSTVSVNTTAGFSIVTYTGTGSNATVGHGLGVAPKMIITFVRNNAGLNHVTYHASLGNTQSVWLNLTNAATTDGAWNNTTPTSTVFSVAGSSSNVNGNGYTIVAYCFAEISGFSKFGSYTGNGSADGTFVFTNFRPKFVIIKRSSSANSWVMFDAARNTYNVTDKTLYPDASAAEETGVMSIDFLSNGFKLRSTPTEINGSGSTYIYACFAENPFKNANAR